MLVCDVPNCPVERARGERFCRFHRFAVTAKSKGLGPDKDGAHAARCVRCRRAFRDDDFVNREAVARGGRRKNAMGYQHVFCVRTPPRPTRKQIRESAKPLLDA